MSVVPTNKSIRFYYNKEENKWGLGYESKEALMSAPKEDATNCLANIIHQCTQLHIDMTTSAKESEKICCLCGQQYTGFGHNPEPLEKYPARCCDGCNAGRVIPERIVRAVKYSNSKYGGGK